jgi:hypothetical protein
MIRLILVAFLSVASLMIGGGCGSEPAPPRLQLPASHIYLGEGDPGETLTAIIRLKNTGGRPLEVREIRSSCGCLVYDPKPPFYVAPDGEQVLKIGIELPKVGEEGGTLLLRSNDPAHSEKVLHVTGRSRALIVVSPPLIDFGSVRPGSTATKLCRLLGADGSPWRSAVDITPSSESLQVSRVANDPSAFMVRLQSQFVMGTFAESLRIAPAGADWAQTVVVVARIQPLLHVVPHTIHAGGAEQSVTVLVKRTDGAPLGEFVRSTGTLGGRLGAVTADQPEGSICRLVLRLDSAGIAGHQSSPGTETLMLWFDGAAEAGELKVVFDDSSDRRAPE